MNKIKTKLELQKIIKGKKALLFDFDGTIAETETLSWEAWNYVLSKYDIHLDLERIQKHIGHTDAEICKMIKRDFKIDFDTEYINSRRLPYYLELTEKRDLKAYKYFYDIYNTNQDMSLNILSSQQTQVIDLLLGRWNLLDRFDNVFSTIDHKITKQEFLSDTKKYLGFAGKELVYFEDNDKYLLAGKNQGILTIGVQTPFNKDIPLECDGLIVPSEYK